MMNADARWSFLAVPLLGVLGCSDPVPPPAQGAVTLSVHTSSSPLSATSCPTGASKYEVGTPSQLCPTSVTGAPTMGCPGGSIISGVNGSSISCSVAGGGDGPYTFSGSLSATTAAGASITLDFSAGTLTKSAGGTATVSVLTPALSGSGPLGSAGCTVKALDVKGGSLWASFVCPQITGAEKQYLCGADGVIVFENCAGS